MLSEHLTERELVVLMGAKSAPTPKRQAPTSETPIEGKAAVTRWLALHDRAVALQVAWRRGECQLPQVVWRGIRSFFLYEHQLSAETRRRARMALWLREHEAPLPDLLTLHHWEACRCPACQSYLHEPATSSSHLVLVAA